MTNSDQFRFHEWQKPEQILVRAGWRPQEGLVFVVEPNGAPKVLRLVRPAIPQKRTTLSHEFAAEAQVPFSDAVPIAVVEVRLLPPPCRSDEASAEALRGEARGDNAGRPFYPPSTTPDWELARLRYDDEVLLPSQEDGDRLSEALQHFLDDRRKEYEARKIELVQLKSLMDRGRSIAGHGRYYSDLASWDRSAWGWQLDQERIRLELGFPSDCLNWTIADARTRPSIRNPILRARWATARQLKLEELASQRERFTATLPKHTKQGVLDLLGTGQKPDIIGVMLGHSKRYAPDLDYDGAKEEFSGAAGPQLDLCAQARYLVTFADETKAWLADCPSREPQNQIERSEFQVVLVPPAIPSIDSTERTEKAAAKLDATVARLEAVPKQIAAKTEALAAVIAPLNKIYSEVELAEIHARAVGKGIPDIFVDWVMIKFQRTDPPTLPTKGDAFNTCGPGTLIGKQLSKAGYGISQQRLADHLTAIRRLLEEKGWLARALPGKARKRAGILPPDDRLQDYNQPSPAELAEDRDEERKHAADLDVGGEDEEESDRNSSR